MRLIDADKALKLFRAEYEETERLIRQGETHLDSLAEGFTEAAHIIRWLAPTVDAVPVVRCRDCKHCQNLPNGLCYLYTEPCDNERGYKGEAVCVEPDDFCSCGEKEDRHETD